MTALTGSRFRPSPRTANVIALIPVRVQAPAIAHTALDAGLVRKLHCRHQYGHLDTWCCTDGFHVLHVKGGQHIGHDNFSDTAL